MILQRYLDRKHFYKKTTLFDQKKRICNLTKRAAPQKSLKKGATNCLVIISSYGTFLYVGHGVNKIKGNLFFMHSAYFKQLEPLQPINMTGFI